MLLCGAQATIRRSEYGGGHAAANASRWQLSANDTMSAPLRFADVLTGDMLGMMRLQNCRLPPAMARYH